MAENKKDAIERCDEAINLASRYGTLQENHHRAWLIDQMCRSLLGDEYGQWIEKLKEQSSDPAEHQWDEGIAPIVD